MPRSAGCDDEYVVSVYDASLKTVRGKERVRDRVSALLPHSSHARPPLPLVPLRCRCALLGCRMCVCGGVCVHAVPTSATPRACPFSPRPCGQVLRHFTPCGRTRAGATSAVVAGLVPGRTYAFKVKACAVDGSVGVYGRSCEEITMPLPSADEEDVQLPAGEAQVGGGRWAAGGL